MARHRIIAFVSVIIGLIAFSSLVIISTGISALSYTDPPHLVSSEFDRIFADTSPATEVHGIIKTNTTWALSGSPYEINDFVQIAPSVTLTIEAGVEVDAIESGGIIETYGGLRVLGTHSAPVKFTGISHDDYRSNNPGQGPIFIRNAEFRRTEQKALLIALGSTGDWKIEDSAFIGASKGPCAGCDTMTLYCRGTNCVIRDSTFVNINASLEDVDSSNSTFQEGGIIFSRNGQHIGNIYSIVEAAFAGQATVESNLFQNVGLLQILVSDGSPDLLLFQQNSLLELAPESVNVRIEPSPPVSTTNANMMNNFWGTTNATEIDTIIFDANDSLDEYAHAIYQPVLTKANPDAPATVPIPPSLYTPTPTSTPTDTPTPTNTPNLMVTETAISERIDIAVAATLTAIAQSATPEPCEVFLPSIK